MLAKISRGHEQGYVAANAVSRASFSAITSTTLPKYKIQLLELFYGT
jgi:hypothetical protein